jgi:hypothetical protein
MIEALVSCTRGAHVVHKSTTSAPITITNLLHVPEGENLAQRQRFALRACQ